MSLEIVSSIKLEGVLSIGPSNPEFVSLFGVIFKLFLFLFFGQSHEEFFSFFFLLSTFY